MRNDDTAFTDIICNILGVMIIVATLGSFLRSAASEHDATESPDRPVEFPYQPPRWRVVQPFSTYYAVGAQGVVALNLEPIARLLAAETGRMKGEVEGITFELQDRWTFHKMGRPDLGIWEERDLDAYSLKTWLDLDALLANATTPQTVPELVAEVMRDNQGGGRSATFLVFASGMDHFVSIHDHLTRARVRFRWLAFPDGQPVTFVRNADQGATYEYRR
jgi:hypothetical protein